MKISVNHIRFYQQKYKWSGDPAPDGVDKLVQRIGAQLAAVEETTDIGSKYNDVVIVKVVSVRKHENSDHLNICLIDDGGVVKDVERNSSGHVQVVCGAPNVRAGLTVAWLPPGSTVPNSFDSEPFVLSVREIRGVVSNGMLASPKELALGDSHDGILEINPEDDGEIEPGTMFATEFGLQDDVVIDMENKMFTHRPDCFGMFGVAREIAGIQGQQFTSPEWYRADATIDTPIEQSLHVKVRNDIPDLVPRFAVVPIAGITVRPSPVWLQVTLSRLGVRPINNIVDLTNYHMLATGQPLHAYDYDRVAGQDMAAGKTPGHATLVVRHPGIDETLELLNGKTIKPRAEAILIASDKKAIGLGGVMGGGSTEVTDQTTNIILECASFDMYSIRRTSMAHGIFSDAVARFNKGQSPLQNMAVLKHITDDIVRLAGGSVAGPVIDDNHLPAEMLERESIHPDITISDTFINARLGLKLSVDQIAKLLRNVEFQVDTDEHDLTIRAPFWRTDIEIPEDIVEEVGRLHGFDKLPLVLPRRSLRPAARQSGFELKTAVRDTLSRAGAHEVLSYTFVDGKLLERAGQDKAYAYKLSNALSPDLQYYRLSLTPSLLEKVHPNIKAGYDEFALFEIGKVHATTETDDDGLPAEYESVACVFAADKKKAASAYAGAAYYQARKYLTTLLAGTADGCTFVPLSEVPEIDDNELMQQLVAPYDLQRSAVLLEDEEIVGIIGEFKPSVRKALKLPEFCAGFEIELPLLARRRPAPYATLPRFPKIRQDICLRVPLAVSYQKLHNFMKQQLDAGQPEGTMFALSPHDIYQREEDAAHKQITFRFEISSYERTMTDVEVAGLLDAAAATAAAEFDAERV